jgi:hypothetical protein
MAEAKDAATNVITAPREFSLPYWAVHNSPRTGFRLLGGTKCCLVLALLLFASLRATAAESPTATAQSSAQTAPAQPSSGKIPDTPPNISYVRGELTINAHDSTLADVLAKVAALTGVQIDAPEGANGEVMSIIQLGPGPARQILASLLSNSNSDYLIQASDTDPEKLQSVLILPRKKRGSEATDMNAATPPSRSPYARVLAAESGEAAIHDGAVPAQLENAAAEASAVNPQIQSMQPEQSAGSIQFHETGHTKSSANDPAKYQPTAAANVSAADANDTARPPASPADCSTVVL